MTLLLVLIFMVALVYASVGHGGASGYLAMMSLCAYAPALMASSALLLNVLVAGAAWLIFWRAGYGSPRLLWPFVVGSVPAAMIGGWLPISSPLYGWLLAVALLIAAVRLCLPTIQESSNYVRPNVGVAVLSGMGIGLVSGIVGVGGGIFLSPLLVLCRWTDLKQAAAVSAGFIVVNSLAGLAGRWIGGRLQMDMAFPLVAAAVMGGLVGSRLGATRLSNRWRRYALAMVLMIAAGKLVVTHG